MATTTTTPSTDKPATTEASQMTSRNSCLMVLHISTLPPLYKLPRRVTGTRCTAPARARLARRCARIGSAKLDGDCDRASVVPTEIGKAARKGLQRRSLRQNEGKRAIFEHGRHAAWSQTLLMDLVHGSL